MMTDTTTRVLLLEDSHSDCLLINHMLENSSQHSFELDQVSSIAELIQRVDEKEFDVVLLDLCVEDSRGVETFSRAHSAAPSLPIIVQSGIDEPELCAEAVRLGAQDYLIKGRFDKETLQRSIRYAIERKVGERALRNSEERYAISVRGAHDGLWDWDIRENRIYYSDRWKAILGFKSDELDGSPESWFDLVHPDDVELLAAAISAHVEGLTDHLEQEYRMQRKNGEECWVLTRGLAVRDEGTGLAYRMAGSLSDINARKRVEARLRHDAFHDRLTGLPNRALCLNRLGHSLRRGQRSPSYRFALLFLDIDGFKLVNDSLGHVCGDMLLVAFARRIQRMIRPVDTFSRLSGDEFCVLLEDICSLSDAEIVADRIHAALEEPFVLSGQEVFASASIGIAESGPSYERPEDIVRDADLAMYRAKRRGKARHEIYDEKLHTSAVRRLELDTDLRRALSRDEFEVHYQPIVRMESSQLTGFEALLRWRSPSRGMVLPDSFIGVAEDTGLIVPIGEWVLQEATKALSSAPALPWSSTPLTISINLSPRQFRMPDVLKQVKAALEKSGLPPHRLVLEITESVFLELSEYAMEVFEQLKALGVQIHLDDFGTGFSSLSYLRQFPVDSLKIDRSFINRMGRSKEDLEIVRAIIALGHGLGKGIVAEGIETCAQVEQLQELRCEYGQGYFFSRPARRSDTGEFDAPASGLYKQVGPAGGGGSSGGGRNLDAVN